MSLEFLTCMNSLQKQFKFFIIQLWLLQWEASVFTLKGVEIFAAIGLGVNTVIFGVIKQYNHKQVRKMNSDDSEMDYAMQVIQQLRNKRFKFHEEAEPNGKKYIFIVNNNEQSEEECSEVFLKAAEDNIQFAEPLTKPPQNFPEYIEDSQPTTTRFVPKNLIKNFVCAFSNFIHSPDNLTSCLECIGLSRFDDRGLEKIKLHLKGLLKAKKFNTAMLQHLLAVKQYRILFKLFLDESATHWIQKGRMEEKEVYVETINYLQSYIDGDNKGRLRFSYKR